MVLQKEKGNLKIGKIIVKVPGNVKEAFASVDEAIEKLMEINIKGGLKSLSFKIICKRGCLERNCLPVVYKKIHENRGSILVLDKRDAIYEVYIANEKYMLRHTYEV